MQCGVVRMWYGGVKYMDVCYVWCVWWGVCVVCKCGVQGVVCVVWGVRDVCVKCVFVCGVFLPRLKGP